MKIRIAAAVAALALSALASAQSFPVRPIRIVVPYAPGGGADAVARIIAQKLNERFAQTILVDNRGGANALIGTEIVARAAPDGYTLLMSDTPHTINPSVFKKVSYDPDKD